MHRDNAASLSRSLTASTNLLRRVKSNESDAWQRLVRIYAPLVYRWARTAGLQEADANDIVGEVFVDVVQGVTRFEKDGEAHSFRRWLRTVASRKMSKHLYRQKARGHVTGGSTANVRLQQVEGQIPADSLRLKDEADWVRQRAMQILKGDCSPAHWAVFEQVVLCGRDPSEVAEASGLTVWAVYKVRSRLLHRLRLELDEL